MKILLMVALIIVAIAAALSGLGAALFGTSAIHQILTAVYWVIFSISLVGIAITVSVDQLRSTTNAAAERTHVHLANIEAFVKYQAEVTKESLAAQPRAPRRLLDDDSPALR